MLLLAERLSILQLDFENRELCSHLLMHINEGEDLK